MTSNTPSSWETLTFTPTPGDHFEQAKRAFPDRIIALTNPQTIVFDSWFSFIWNKWDNEVRIV